MRQGTGLPPSESGDLLDQYTWAPHVLTFGLIQPNSRMDAVIPGIGMMANCHFGLLNFARSEPWKAKPWLDGTDWSLGADSLAVDDAGRGSHSPHSQVMFEASKFNAIQWLS